MIQVLDQGWVELQDVMGDDLAIVSAARTSYLGDSRGTEQDKKLLFYLMKNGHHGPFEMAELRFRLYAPEVVWRQLLRHRTGSYNLQSYRYTEAEQDDFYLPSVWRLQSSTNKQASQGELDRDFAQDLTQGLRQYQTAGYHLYKSALALGVAREQARLFLPAFGLYSLGVVKFDLRNLIHFLQLRTASDAQFEIREYAEAMMQLAKDKFAWTFEGLEAGLWK